MDIITQGQKLHLKKEFFSIEKSFEPKKNMNKARAEFCETTDIDKIITIMKSPLEHEVDVLRRDLDK